MTSNAKLSDPTCFLVLAAGESSRYGYFPKQLLQFEGRSLIRRAVETALASKATNVRVVLGANAEKISPELADLPVSLVINAEWASGIGSSIVAGIRDALSEFPDFSRIGILLADQPLIKSADLDKLLDAARDAAIAAASYGGTVGVPAVFNKTVFGELLKLDPENGAREIILRHREKAILIDLSAAGFDIDRPSDLDALRNISIADN